MMVLCEARRAAYALQIPPRSSYLSPSQIDASRDRRTPRPQQKALGTKPSSLQLQEAMQAVFIRTHDRAMNREERVQFGIANGRGSSSWAVVRVQTGAKPSKMAEWQVPAGDETALLLAV